MSEETTPTTASKWPYLRAFIQSGLEEGGRLETLPTDTKELIHEALADVARLEREMQSTADACIIWKGVAEARQTVLGAAREALVAAKAARLATGRRSTCDEQVHGASHIQCGKCFICLERKAIAPQAPGAKGREDSEILSQDDMDRELHGS